MASLAQGSGMHRRGGCEYGLEDFVIGDAAQRGRWNNPFAIEESEMGESLQLAIAGS
jgi:hypothetical protein